jgi:hypothetical protein
MIIMDRAAVLLLSIVASHTCTANLYAAGDVKL